MVCTFFYLCVMFHLYISIYRVATIIVRWFKGKVSDTILNGIDLGESFLKYKQPLYN